MQFTVKIYNRGLSSIIDDNCHDWSLHKRALISAILSKAEESGWLGVMCFLKEVVNVARFLYSPLAQSE